MAPQTPRRALVAVLAAALALAASAAPPPPPPSPPATGTVYAAPPSAPKTVAFVKQSDSSWGLTVNGAPYYVKGMVVSNPGNFSLAASLGVNTVRTYASYPWAGPAGYLAFMNSAAAAGLNVMMGLQIPALVATTCSSPTSPACWYAPVNWEANLANLAASVAMFKGYPNLLFWVVGNEISLGVSQSTPGWQQMWQFVGAACAMIKAMDPYHPVGTATPDIDQFTMYALNTYVPMAQTNFAAAALDFLGSNVYGNAGLMYPAALQACAQSPPGVGCSLQAANVAYSWQKPYVMSELGPNNWFHVSQTYWGDWVEQYSTRKSWMYQQIWATARNSSSKTAPSSAPAVLGYATAPPALGLNGGGCVGAFFFSFGWIWQASSTWINLINGYNYTWGPSGPNNGVMGKTMLGQELADPVDAIQKIYTGALPTNQAPAISAPGLMINGYTYDNSITIVTGTLSTAKVVATDPNGDSLVYTWALLPQPTAPTDHTTWAPIPFGAGTASPSNSASSITFYPPAAPGPYRLVVYVQDGKGKMATASCPFFVTTDIAPIMIKNTADSYITDGKLLASGIFGGVGGVATTTINNGSSTSMEAQVSYAPVTTQVTAAQAGVGGNNFPVVGFTFPTGAIPSGFGTPSKVILNLYMQHGTPVTSMTGLNIYAMPNTWSESTITFATSPCNVPSTSTTLAYGVEAGTAMPGTCKTLAAAVTATTLNSLGNVLLGPNYSPDDCCDSPGLQLDGNYIRINITPYIAPLLAAGETSFAFLIQGAGPYPAPPPMLFQTKETWPWPVLAGQTVASGENAPYLEIWPPAKAGTLSTALQIPVGAGGITTAQQSALQAAIASGVPGALASQVVLTVSGHTVTCTIALSAGQASSFTPAMQLALAKAVTADMGLAATDVTMGVATAATTGRHLSQAGIEVPVVLSGYSSGSDVGLSASIAAGAQLQAALSTPGSAINSFASANSLGSPSAGLPPISLQQMQVAVSPTSGRRSRNLLQASGAPPAPMAPAGTLNDYVNNGGLAQNLATQPGAGNMTVYPAGRSKAFSFIGELKAMNLKQVFSAQQLQQDKAWVTKYMPFLALIAVLLLASCACTWCIMKGKEKKLQQERDDMAMSVEGLQHQLEDAQMRLREAQQRNGRGGGGGQQDGDMNFDLKQGQQQQGDQPPCTIM